MIQIIWNKDWVALPYPITSIINNFSSADCNFCYPMTHHTLKYIEIYSLEKTNA